MCIRLDLNLFDDDNFFISRLLIRIHVVRVAGVEPTLLWRRVSNNKDKTHF